ncbi:MAG TPA: endolytic transglycosylase MltG, partial [Euzebya sp.]|nr:endolytic transglycosylase MltG [Euzebya sp.]
MTNSSKVFLVVLILMIAGGYYLFQQWNPGIGGGAVELATEPVDVTIPEGTGARDVAQILEDHRVVRSASAFTAAATIDGRANSILAGSYTLDPSLSTEELLDVLTSGPPAAETYTVTIPEGLTVDQTLTRIAETEGSPLTVEDLRTGLGMVALPAWVPPDRELPEGGEAFEGLLWPETYEFTVNATAEEVLTRLITQADTVVGEVGGAAR